MSSEIQMQVIPQLVIAVLSLLVGGRMCHTFSVPLPGSAVFMTRRQIIPVCTASSSGQQDTWNDRVFEKQKAHLALAILQEQILMARKELIVMAGPINPQCVTKTESPWEPDTRNGLPDFRTMDICKREKPSAFFMKTLGALVDLNLVEALALPPAEWMLTQICIMYCASASQAILAPRSAEPTFSDDPIGNLSMHLADSHAEFQSVWRSMEYLEGYGDSFIASARALPGSTPPYRTMFEFRARMAARQAVERASGRPSLLFCAAPALLRRRVAAGGPRWAPPSVPEEVRCACAVQGWLRVPAAV